MHAQERTVQAWMLKTAETIGPVAAASDAGWTLVATGDRVVHILDKAGKVRGRFKAGQPIRQLCTNEDGTVLTALAGEAVVYAFNRRGELDWRVELGGAVTAFALDASGEHLAGVSAGGWLYTYSPATRDRRLAPVGWPMASVAVVGGDDVRVLVAGEKGRLAFLDADGKPQWEKDLNCPIGPVSADAAGARIFVPARERGLLVLGADGAEAGKLHPGGDVVCAQAGPEGYPVMVELSDGRLLLLDEGLQVVWERSPDPAQEAWAFGAAGTRLVVVEGERKVVACRVKASEAAPPELTSARPSPLGRRPPDMSEPVEVYLPEYLEIEEAMADKAPPPAPPKTELHLKWKKRLPAAMLPVRPGCLRIGSDGAFAVVVLADGTVAGLDRQGAAAVKCQAADAAEIVPQSFAGTVAVRAGTRLHVLDLPKRSVREIALGDEEPAAFGCSADLGVLYVLDRAGGLSALGVDGEALWQTALGADADSLLVSPDGQSVLVCDSGHRFRYYGAEGELQRKFRFGDAQGHRPVVLGNDFSAFVGPGGRLTVLDASGRQLWGRRMFQTVTHVAQLDGALAVYGENGVCAVVEPRRDRVWEFVPPPGRALLRKPAGGDPVLVHAAAGDVTVFSGYRRKLDVLWRFRCSGEVELLDADRDARCIIVLADRKLHRLESGRP